MKFNLIRPNRPDLSAQFKLIKRAFNGVDNAKAEFEFCCDAVISKRASLYHLFSRKQGVSLRFVGYVTSDNDYLILAMTGKGLLKGAPAIIEAVKSQGYRSIKYHTVRAGMTRILKGFGFVLTGKSEHDSVLSLNLEGC
ncbi:hypothetical protein H4F17_13890 [Vibrio cholerae]|uniref:hypothetical protein n=1 Tax=Vibrio sonorensis TaxID=1004316 RepID=UPI0008D8D8A7|nr:hypothetical protein [Vibrio sonorensis]